MTLLEGMERLRGEEEEHAFLGDRVKKNVEDISSNLESNLTNTILVIDNITSTQYVANQPSRRSSLKAMRQQCYASLPKTMQKGVLG
ncbi:MAG TPA: hypothetical protein VFS97_07585 [Nitrososphaeraceae archaeon]|nr:hypothetical protein [Nitrososphaeraceae archaeon]